MFGLYSQLHFGFFHTFPEKNKKSPQIDAEERRFQRDEEAFQLRQPYITIRAANNQIRAELRRIES